MECKIVNKTYLRLSMLPMFPIKCSYFPIIYIRSMCLNRSTNAAYAGLTFITFLHFIATVIVFILKSNYGKHLPNTRFSEDFKPKNIHHFWLEQLNSFGQLFFMKYEIRFLHSKNFTISRKDDAISSQAVWFQKIIARFVQINTTRCPTRVVNIWRKYIFISI